jgi:sn-glycerol 3-phosphate transport system ATP-binding protein
MSQIVIRQLRKSYGRTEVVRGIDLVIDDGDFVVVLGPSGCGKSTLLRMVAGLEDITAGDISIDGRIVNRLEPRERGCAMVFQNYALYPHMSVEENIGYGLKVAGVKKPERQRRVAEVAGTLGLSDMLKRKPAALSGGQRQRVAMGRAMIREPRVFLFDEPLSNLDAKLRVQLRLEIRQLHQRLKTTSIFVTHDQIEAMTLADKLVVLNKGQIEQVGTPTEIYHRPNSLFVAEFIGSPPMNILQGEAVDSRYLQLTEDWILPTATLPLTGSVTIGFRPEDAHVTLQPIPGAVAFDVAMIEELGAGQLAHGHVGRQSLIVHLPKGSPAIQGRRLFVSVATAHLHLFDPASGRRLDIDPSFLEGPGGQVVSLNAAR